jgi:hypothetical protein
MLQQGIEMLATAENKGLNTVEEKVNRVGEKYP